MTDRLGVGALIWGLGINQIVSGGLSAGLIALTLAAFWFLRVMNGDRLDWLRMELEAVDSGSLTSTGTKPLTAKQRYFRWAASHRLTPWLVHDVEWLFLSLVAGPLTDRVGGACALALAGMLGQTALLTFGFWRRRWRLFHAADLARWGTPAVVVRRRGHGCQAGAEHCEAPVAVATADARINR
jgi:hypothetical protein